jgi:hypothetical protein
MRRLLTIVTVLLAVPACGGGSNTPTTPSAPKQASIAVAVSPNPVTTSTCSPTCTGTSGNSYQFQVRGTLTIQETAGVAGNVDSIVSGSINFVSADVAQRSGTSRVAASGSLVFPLDFVFGAVDNANANRSVVFPVTVNFTDDRGNHLTGVTQWVAN